MLPRYQAAGYSGEQGLMQRGYFIARKGQKQELKAHNTFLRWEIVENLRGEQYLNETAVDNPAPW